MSEQIARFQAKRWARPLQTELARHRHRQMTNVDRMVGDAPGEQPHSPPGPMYSNGRTKRGASTSPALAGWSSLRSRDRPVGGPCLCGPGGGVRYGKRLAEFARYPQVSRRPVISTPTMNCPKCGAQIPDGSRFCLACGASLAAPASGASPTSPAATRTATSPLAASGVGEFKCPSCGAPLKPVFGEMVITCDYCGASVTLGGAGWKEIQKHTMLSLAVSDSKSALTSVQRAMDVGLFHHHVFEESTVSDAKLSYVPFWVLPVNAVTNYTYQDGGASVGATVGTLAAADILGGMLSGGRGGGFMMMPIFAGPVVPSTRQATISKSYEYPIVAVKAMTQYQPRDYSFALGDRALFDRKAIPSGAPVLNGDLGEDAARHSAQAYGTQHQSEEAHHAHHMVSGLSSQVTAEEGELLHVPVWHFSVERKGIKTIVLVDGHTGALIRTVT